MNHPQSEMPAAGFHNRPATRAGKNECLSLFDQTIDCFLGVRNLFDSSFMLSGNRSLQSEDRSKANEHSLGEQWDDGNVRKTTRVQQPPGGQSKG